MRCREIVEKYGDFNDRDSLFSDLEAMGYLFGDCFDELKETLSLECDEVIEFLSHFDYVNETQYVDLNIEALEEISEKLKTYQKDEIFNMKVEKLIIDIDWLLKTRMSNKGTMRLEYLM